MCVWVVGLHDYWLLYMPHRKIKKISCWPIDHSALSHLCSNSLLHYFSMFSPLWSFNLLAINAGSSRWSIDQFWTSLTFKHNLPVVFYLLHIRAIIVKSHIPYEQHLKWKKITISCIEIGFEFSFFFVSETSTTFFFRGKWKLEFSTSCTRKFCALYSHVWSKVPHWKKRSEISYIWNPPVNQFS